MNSTCNVFCFALCHRVSNDRVCIHIRGNILDICIGQSGKNLSDLVLEVLRRDCTITETLFGSMPLQFSESKQCTIEKFNDKVDA